MYTTDRFCVEHILEVEILLSLSLYGQHRHCALNNFSWNSMLHISLKIYDDEYIFVFFDKFLF